MKHTFAVVAALAIAATMYATPAYAQTEAAASSDGLILGVTAITITGIITAGIYLSKRGGSGDGKQPINLQNPTDAENKPSTTKDYDRITNERTERDNSDDARDRAEDRANRRRERAILDQLNFNAALRQMASASRQTAMLDADAANEVADEVSANIPIPDEERPGGALGVNKPGS